MGCVGVSCGVFVRRVSAKVRGRAHTRVPSETQPGKASPEAKKQKQGRNARKSPSSVRRSNAVQGAVGPLPTASKRSGPGPSNTETAARSSSAKVRHTIGGPALNGRLGCPIFVAPKAEALPQPTLSLLTRASKLETTAVARTGLVLAKA